MTAIPATINGVEFTLSTIPAMSAIGHSQTNSPGSDTNPITYNGRGGLRLPITGLCETQDEYDNVITEFMRAGEQTLIVNSGWEYRVYAAQFAIQTHNTALANTYPFSLEMLTTTPYQYSDSDTTSLKTITTNNQEWSASDGAVDITTDGKVDAIPSVEVVGGALGGGYSRETNPLSQTDTSTYGTNSTSFVLLQTTTFAANVDYGTKINQIGMDIRSTDGAHFGYGKITIQSASLYGGVETDLISWGPQSAWASFTTTVSESGAVNEVLYIRFYGRTDNGAFTAQIRNLDVDSAELRLAGVTGLTIHNTADTTTAMAVANRILPEMVVRINSDGSGSVVYSDDFDDAVYANAAYALSGVTQDDPNDELDIADTGYIVYQIDAKYPITGIPILTSQIDITAGTPTIQISSDGVTFYDIDTAIVDDVLTAYQLDNAINLTFKDGHTLLYFRIDCTGAGTNTCSIKTFAAAISIITVDAQRFFINVGGANTLKAVQDADSSFACTVNLIYRDRKYAG